MSIVSKAARDRAVAWVMHLGWDPCEALDYLEAFDEATLLAVERILRSPNNGPEPGRERVEMLSNAGIQVACEVLSERARWEDEGGAVFYGQSCD